MRRRGRSARTSVVSQEQDKDEDDDEDEYMVQHQQQEEQCLNDDAVRFASPACLDFASTTVGRLSTHFSLFRNEKCFPFFLSAFNLTNNSNSNRCHDPKQEELLFLCFPRLFFFSSCFLIENEN